MAVSYVGAGTRSFAANGATSPGLPAGLQSGDLLVLMDCVVSWAGTANTPGTPSGWTQKATSARASNGRLTWMYARYLSGMAAPTVTYSGSAQDVHYSRIFAFRGVVGSGDPTDVLGASSTNAFVKDVGPISGVTTTASGGVVLVGFVRESDWNPAGGVPALSGDGLTWVEVEDFTDYAAGDNFGVALDYALTSSPTAVTAKTFVVDTGNTAPAVGRMWALLPAPTAAPPVVLVASVEVGAALSVSRRKSLTLGRAVESGAGLAVASRKTLVVGRAVESSAAAAVQFPVKVAAAAESETASAVSRAKRQVVAWAGEAAVGFGVARHKDVVVGPAVEAATAPGVVRWRALAAGRAVELDAAPGVGRHRTVPVGVATELGAAAGVGWRKALVLGRAVEVQQPGPVVVKVVPRVAVAVESDAALAVSRRKLVRLGPAVETGGAALVFVSALWLPRVSGTRVVSRLLVGSVAASNQLAGVHDQVRGSAVVSARLAGSAGPLGRVSGSVSVGRRLAGSVAAERVSGSVAYL